MIKIINSIDVTQLLAAYDSFKDNIKWVDYGKCKQASLQYKTNENPYISGLGKGDGTDLEYVNLNENYKNTFFENLIIQYNLKRTRFMMVEPWSCYSIHADTTPRIHIPIITNSECYFLFKNGHLEHLPVGQVYLVDTTKEHTFINCSNRQRLHLMGSVES
jgi:hypothetical protein